MRHSTNVSYFRCYATLPRLKPTPEAHWQQLTTQAQELYRQGRYAEAMPVAQEALALAEATFGPAHLHVAASRHTLARLAHALGHYADAEALFQQALTQREHLWGLTIPR